MLGYAVVGCGYVAGRHVRADVNMPDTTVAVLCDVREEAAKEAAEKHDLDCPITPSMEEAIARDDVDVVVVALPTPLHLAACELAAKAGKHVYVEKPIAQSLDEARRIIALCDEARVKLVIGQSHRYFPVLRRAREIILAGDLGRLVKVRSVLCYYKDFAEETRKWKVDGSTEMNGSVLDVGVHLADDIRFLSDSPVTRVYAEGGRLRSDDCPVVDVASALMRLANGAVAELEVSETQLTGGKFPCQMSTEVYGTEGSLLVVGDNLSIYRQGARQGAQQGASEPYREETHSPEEFFDIWEDLHRDFVASILEDKPVPIPPAVGYDALAVVDAIFRSMRDHEVVEIPAP